MSQKYAIIIPAVDMENNNAIQIVCDGAEAKKVARICGGLPSAYKAKISLAQKITSGGIQLDNCYQVMVATQSLSQKEELTLIKDICKELEKLVGHKRVACLL